MYFNITADHGHEVHGYLIPDGFSVSPRVVVRADDITYGPFNCDVFLSGPYEHKHHETGIVGFVVTQEHIPELNAETDIEVSDADTGLTFYRRFRPDIHVPKRVFRLETCFVPHSELDQSLKPYFQFHASEVDQYGSETVRQMLEIHQQSSVYVSGKVLLKPMQTYLNSDIVRIVSLRDPFYELAVRLVVLAKSQKQSFQFISKRDEMILKPVMDYFADTDFKDPQNLEAKINTAPKEVLQLLDSPFIHQLLASNPTERVPRDALSKALDALSQFSLIDPDENDDLFLVQIAEYLSIPQENLRFLSNRTAFKLLADRLRDIPTCQHMLEKDLILFHFIQKAKENVLKK